MVLEKILVEHFTSSLPHRKEVLVLARAILRYINLGWARDASLSSEYFLTGKGIAKCCKSHGKFSSLFAIVVSFSRGHPGFNVVTILMRLVSRIS